MKLNRVLIVYKDVQGPTHKVHRLSIKRVVATFEAHQIRYRLVKRDMLRPVKNCDLIVTIGGDGTVMAAAHVARNTPILGINSLPHVSIGYFCATTTAGLSRYLSDITKKRRHPVKLPLLNGWINGKKLSTPALNDFLYAPPSPAQSVVYRLRIGTRSERQRSSGIWITAGPGSTAGYRSAGGTPAPITSEQLRYMVREPVIAPKYRYRLARGVLTGRKKLSIACEGRGGTIYLDGVLAIRPLDFGDIFTVSRAKETLTIFLRPVILSRRRRIQ